MKTNFHNKNFALSLAFIMRFKATRKWRITLYYINTNEIPGELSRENISSHVKRSRLLWLHDTSRLRSKKKNVKVKWFGISLVFI